MEHLGNTKLKEKYKKGWGGVCILIKEEIIGNQTPVWVHKQTAVDRVQIVSVRLKDHLYIGVYNAIFGLDPIPNHEKMFTELSNLIDIARKSNSEIKITIGGDFNAATLVHEHYHEHGPLKPDLRVNQMYEEFLSNKQMVIARGRNNAASRGAKVLDIFMVDAKQADSEYTGTITFDDFYHTAEAVNPAFETDHKVVELEVLGDHIKSNEITWVEQIDFTKFDPVKCGVWIQETGIDIRSRIEFGNITTRNQVEEIDEKITEILTLAMEASFGTSMKARGRSRKQFVTSNYSTQVRNISKRIKRAINGKSKQAIIEDPYVNTLLKIKASLVEKETLQIMEETMTRCKNDPRALKAFFSGSKESNLGPIEDPATGKLEHNPQKKADIIGNQFKSQLSEVTEEYKSGEVTLREMESVMDRPIVTNAQIRKAIEKLNPKSAPGPDGIPAKLIKCPRMMSFLTPIFRKELQMQYDTGMVPKNQKCSNVAPIPKKKGSTKAED